MFNFLDVLDDYSCLFFDRNKTLLFQHIPRTSGRAIIERLKTELFMQSLSQRKVQTNTELDSFLQLPLGYTVNLLSGHITTKQVKNISIEDKRRIDIITWYRHPVSRMISNYFLAKNFCLENQIKYLTIEQYIEDQPENVMLNNWLLSEPCDTLSQVLDNLKERYAFIGLKEKNDLCAYILGYLLDICQSPFSILNAKNEDCLYPQSVLVAIQEKSLLDIAFYDYLFGRYEQIYLDPNKIKHCYY